MFTLSQLLTLDQSLKIRNPSTASISVEGICVAEFLEDNKILFIKDERYLKTFLARRTSQKPIVITNEKIAEILSDKEASAILVTNDVPYSMCLLSKPFYDKKFSALNDVVDGRQMGTVLIHPSALIAQNVFLGENVEIGCDVKIHSGSVIMSGSKIGDGSILFPNITLYPFSKIGKNCRLHSGCIIGADGFGYHFAKGVHHKIWHIGDVIIGDDVEIGAGSTIDRGAFVDTEIGSGSKIDNQVQVGHNSKLGRGVILCGQVGLSGSAKLSDYVVCGGKAGIGPDVELGIGVQVAGNGMVTGDWPAGSQVAGHPARPVKEWLRGVAAVRKLIEKKSN
jgi:UDP-3-O-[3-hydroxymyristoyl] glucosamine N-acyltransferase